MGKLVFAIAAIATLAFTAPVYANPDCSGCVIADGGCSTCIIAGGGGIGGNATGFVACTAEDNKGHCVESASYQCPPYVEACRFPRKPRSGKIADGSCSGC